MAVTIYWAADSTVQYNDITTYPQTGIGQVMQLYLKPEVRVCNLAKNGRSSKSFLEEGRFHPIIAGMKEGDFLFIQFGHNDEKNMDLSRYTRPQIEFKENLNYMIDKALERGAYPVLISPLERRLFEDAETLKPSQHTDYVSAMKEVAEERQVVFIDLCQLSRRLMEEAGFEETKKWFMHLPAGVYASSPDGKEDNTHLRYEGAVIFAGQIANALRQIGGAYKEITLDPSVEES